MPRRERGEVSSLSPPLSLALLAAEPRAALRVHIRAEAGRGTTATDYKLLARSEEEQEGGASAVAVRPSVLSDSVRASERSVWSGVTTTYYVCLVGGDGAAPCNSRLPLLLSTSMLHSSF